MSSLQDLQVRSHDLEQQIQLLESWITEAPEGRLTCRSIAPGQYAYYRKSRDAQNKTRETYLTKSQYPVAVGLARKVYAKQRIPELKQEKDALDRWIMIRSRNSPAEELLRKKPGLAKLLTPDLAAGSIFTDDEKTKALEWKNQPYNRNLKHPDQLKYSTVIPGLLVRSKSEASIISCLEKLGIPYHYDEILQFGNTAIAMDFVCLNVRSRRIWYWDHRGMMDNPDYIQKTLYCERHFLNANIIQGINLIVTTETKDVPLDLQWVETLAKYYLL